MKKKKTKTIKVTKHTVKNLKPNKGQRPLNGISGIDDLSSETDRNKD